jgi:DNA polymerase-3 subunit delta'
MGFEEFIGNEATVRQLREMLGRGRFPHALILTGPRGAGKYKLAMMMARAMNCQNQPRDEEGLPEFCGHCPACEQIAEGDDLEARFHEAVEAREALKESEKKETSIMVQTHPDVLVIPPDPPQLLVKVGQVRHLISTVYYQPQAGHRKVYIFPEANFMKEAANSLLKILEEPPEFATLFLLAENATQLLPTIRSRCITLRLAPLEAEAMEQALQRRVDLTAVQRQLVARLSGGAVGRALGFDLGEYIAARKDALAILRTSVEGGGHDELFRVTEGYRAGAEGRVRTEHLLDVLYSLLQDVTYLSCGTPELVRNTDLQAELSAMAGARSFEWLADAVRRVDEVRQGMRRNLLRSLSLDALAVSLEH